MVTSPPAAATRQVLVAGAMANKAGNGGEAWVRLSWIHAFEELGAEVAFVERLGRGHSDPGRAVAWFRAVTGRFGLEHRSWLVSADTGATFDDRDVLVGDPETLRHELARAETLVDVSGNIGGWAAAAGIPCRVHVDIDPGYTQVWAATGHLDLGWYHVHATIGTALGSGSCPFPTAGLDWIAVRQPVHLADWPAAPISTLLGDEGAAFTTVSSWRGPYGPLEWREHRYGVKAHRFRALSPIARRAAAPLEIALQIDPADEQDVTALRRDGWRIAEPSIVAGTPEAFAAYVDGSLGELSIAHPVYVEGRTGWFSDRTVRYLASGRPAIVEDTGWSHDLPSGCGLLAFTDGEEAIAATHAVLDDPVAHAAGARRIAAEFFSPRPALAPLLDAIGWQP